MQKKNSRNDKIKDILAAVPNSSLVRVGITMGDPAGIGPTIIIKGLKALAGKARFIIFGDRWILEKKGRIESFPQVDFVDVHSLLPSNFSFGKVKAENGKAAVDYLERALIFWQEKRIDCLVTCPISKEALFLAGFPFSGHTEYLAKKTQCKDVAMMLLNKHLKISLVTRHVPLKLVSSRLRPKLLAKTISLTFSGLQELFRISSPRIVVCGLNPHASDNGLIGNEEKKFILPLVNNLKDKGYPVSGPLPADVALLKAYEGEYDAVIALYHDQALIPLKLLGSGSGVNLTLGLPFVRTSPLHGTAFDIADSFSANPASFISAVKLAIKCTLNQRKASAKIF